MKWDLDDSDFFLSYVGDAENVESVICHSKPRHIEKNEINIPDKEAFWGL